MNGWMFFPRRKKKKLSSEDAAALLLEMLEADIRISKEEWNTYIPESRESLQGRSLGFYCGGAGLAALKNTPAAQDMPEYPMLVFVSDFSIMPECWTFKEALIAESEPVREYIIRLLPDSKNVITVTSTLPDRPPCFAVYGSYCFFPPPYVLKGNTRS